MRWYLALAMLAVYAAMLGVIVTNLVSRCCCSRDKKISFMSTFLISTLLWSSTRVVIWSLALAVEWKNAYVAELLVCLSFATETGSFALIILFFVKILASGSTWLRMKRFAKIAFLSFYTTLIILAVVWAAVSGALRTARSNGDTKMAKSGRRVWGSATDLYDRIDNILFCLVFLLLGLVFLALAAKLAVLARASEGKHAQRAVLLPMHPAYLCLACAVLGMLHLSRAIADLLAGIGVQIIGGSPTQEPSIENELLIVGFYVLWDIVPTLILLFVMQLDCHIVSRRRCCCFSCNIGGESPRLSSGQTPAHSRRGSKQRLADGAFALMVDGSEGGGSSPSLYPGKSAVISRSTSGLVGRLEKKLSAPSFGVFGAIASTNAHAPTDTIATDGATAVHPLEQHALTRGGSGGIGSADGMMGGNGSVNPFNDDDWGAEIGVTTNTSRIDPFDDTPSHNDAAESW